LESECATGAEVSAVEFSYSGCADDVRTTIRAMTDDGKAGGVVTRVLVRKNLIVRWRRRGSFRQG